MVQVDMMSRTFRSKDMQATQTVRYSEVAGKFRAVRLPYKGSSGLAAVFVLPDKKYKSVFDAVGDITASAVFDRNSWVKLYDVGSLSVSVPRFKVAVNQLSLTQVCVVDEIVPCCRAPDKTVLCLFEALRLEGRNGDGSMHALYLRGEVLFPVSYTGHTA